MCLYLIKAADPPDCGLDGSWFGDSVLTESQHVAFIKQSYSLSWSNQTKGKGSSAHANNYHMNEDWIKHTHPSVYLYSIPVSWRKRHEYWNPDFVLGKTRFSILCYSCVKSINATKKGHIDFAYSHTYSEYLLQNCKIYFWKWPQHRKYATKALFVSLVLVRNGKRKNNFTCCNEPRVRVTYSEKLTVNFIHCLGYSTKEHNKISLR